MATTLDGVARHARVSTATVSRVLRGANGEIPISAATRQRVLAAVRELDYRPNLTARSLARGRTHTIGVVLPEGAMRLRRVYNATILAGISDVLTARGYALALYFSEFGRQPQAPGHISLLQDGRVDGGLIVDSFALDDEQIAALEREAGRFPCVLIGHRLPQSRLHWVAADDRAGAIAAVDHLYQLGHRRIAHLYNRRGRPGSERQADYQEALAARGLEARSDWLVASEMASGMAALVDRATREMGELWTHHEPPTALFAWNDYAALAAIQGLRQTGVVVPRDVSVVGYSDFDVAVLGQPPLTTVRTPLYEQGALAAEVLLDTLDSGNAQPVQRLLPTVLVVRESTGSAPQPG
ncbi:MAG: LacI family transcriptional regulator [Planctomycetes bacterium]|nr:LacI family transcriptional regulator [Planctomycetota bacterium]